MSDKSHLRKAYAIMRGAFPRWAAQQTVASVDAWGELLDDIEPDLLVSAVKRLAQSATFPPEVARIREEANREMRLKASRASAVAHERWVAEQERRATEKAEERLRRDGINPDEIQRTSIRELLRGIGR
jgi:hypothetical protein